MHRAGDHAAGTLARGAAAPPTLTAMLLCFSLPPVTMNRGKEVWRMERAGAAQPALLQEALMVPLARARAAREAMFRSISCDGEGAGVAAEDEGEGAR